MPNWSRWWPTKAQAVEVAKNCALPKSSVWKFESRRRVYRRMREGFFILNGSNKPKNLPRVIAAHDGVAEMVWESKE